MAILNPLIQGINHFALSVKNLDESIEFYTRILQLSVIEKRQNAAFLDANGACVLALLQYPGDDFDEVMKPKKMGKSFTHFGFKAAKIDDIDLMEERLLKFNVEVIIKGYKRFDGASVYFLDPNGYTIEYLYFKPA